MLILVALCLFTTSVQAQDTPPTASKKHLTKLPGLVIDHKNGYLDISGKVVLRDGDWLELLLCTPGTREHESILSTAARPSHIHLGLIMLGLKPGKPMTAQKVGEELKITQASGPLISVDLIYIEDDKQQIVNANKWIYNKNTGNDLPDNLWLFAGSSFIKAHDQNIYRADANGSVITLVHFGDDMLARQTQVNSRNDNGQWQARTKNIPPLGTNVTIRLTPIKTDQKTLKTENQGS
ncbi:MAG TPA: hypothetical protein DCM28_19820 [Phycisphaerales bacterium]|nr:hypothetical protein [Phycisphaerales bacterium]HCD32727.1 hypothetical protein [Phycisphaerales bacterium]